MKRSGKYLLIMGALTTASVPSLVHGIPGWEVCFDPLNTQPISPDALVAVAGNSIIVGGIGVTGWINWGPNSPCGIPPGNELRNIPGYLQLHVGPQGSLESSTDDWAPISFGALDPTIFLPPTFLGAGNEWSYATIRVVAADGSTEDIKFQGGGARSTFSFRRVVASETVGTNTPVRVDLVMRSVGGSIRYEWTLTNLTQTQIQVGFRHMTWIGMITNDGVSGFAGGTYTLAPNLGYLPIEVAFVRSIDPMRFPNEVQFHFRQSNPYPSLRVLTGPDPAHPDQTRADSIILANYDWPTDADNLWNFPVAFDRGVFNTAFALYFYPTFVPPGGSRRIVYYLEPAWVTVNNSLGNDGAFAIATEAPWFVNYSASGTNRLNPNPFFVTLWVDNQYGNFGETQELTMRNVNCTIALAPGLSLDTGETATKTISAIGPAGVSTVRWRVVADGVRAGLLQYQISVSADPGGNKTISRSVFVSHTPVKDIVQGPQLVGFPWTFSNPNLNVVLGLNSPADYTAYDWDALTQSYTITTQAKRGVGQWIVATSDFPGTLYTGASAPNDAVSGGFRTRLRRGWNLMANPYPFALPLGQLRGIRSDRPTEVLTWSEMTGQGLRNVVFSYDVVLGDYIFTSDPLFMLPPGEGHWVFLSIPEGIHMDILWPPIYQPGLPGSPRVQGNPWTGSPNRWRLQVVARGKGLTDTSNYLGIVPDRTEAQQLSFPEPPPVPGSSGRLAFVKRDAGGMEMRWAQDIREKSNRHVFTVEFSAFSTGTYTIMWPNIREIPRNVRLRFVDSQAGQARDMRTTSGYTFSMAEPGVRRFEIILESGGVASRPVIGNVLVSSAGRGVNSAITIQYSLNTSAEVTVRILSLGGQPIATLARGQASEAGVSTVSWSKRTDSGRAVAPGNYIVEIVAESGDGQRVRVTRPVIVVR